MKYASFIRGINVSGKNIVRMADFRVELEKVGLKGVQTYIQSGNVISNRNIDQKKWTNSETTDIITSVLKSHFDVDTSVFTIDVNYLEAILKANPFRNEDPKKVAIGFLDKTPNMIELPGIKEEKYLIGDNCIYLFYPEGMGKSKLTNAIIEKKMNVVSTMRNMNTSNKILELLKQ